MENTNNKIITMSFIVAGILIWTVTKVLIETIAGMVPGSISRMMNTDMVMHGLPLVLAVGSVLILHLNKKVMIWADEVVSEIRKVVWPSRKDTVAMTIVVCVMLVIAGLILGGLDIVSAYAVDTLLNINV